MKKITLSAAVLALAMMGCSDAGLDNSVASTNEVKNESQNAALLAKSGSNSYYPNIDQPYAYQMPLSESITYNFQVGAIKMRMNSSYGTHMYGTNNGKMYAVGTCSVDKSMGGYAREEPDLIRAITLPLYNCSVDQNPPHYTVHCDNRGFNPDRNTNFLEIKQVKNANTATAVSRELNTNSVWSTVQNSITYCIAVWNKGKQNQTILAGTVFGGDQFKNNMFLAQRAYNQIFLPAIDNWCVNHLAECQALDQ